MITLWPNTKKRHVRAKDVGKGHKAQKEGAKIGPNYL